MMIDEKNYAWHFIARDMRLGYDDGRIVIPGDTLTHDGDVELCLSGLHASIRAIDALRYASDKPIVCRVRLGGLVVHRGNKSVAARRTCLWAMDAERVLHEFALWCAESVIHYAVDHGGVCRAALAAKRAWLSGNSSAAQSAAASAAGWDAASTAAASATQNAQLELMLKAAHRKTMR